MDSAGIPDGGGEHRAGGGVRITSGEFPHLLGSGESEGQRKEEEGRETGSGRTNVRDEIFLG